MILDPIAMEISFRRSQKLLWLSTKEMKEIQEKKLRNLIEHAYNTVSYYHKIFNNAGIKPSDIRHFSDLEKIPILSKSDLKNAKESMISRKVALNKCVLHQTSGSTGIPLKIFFTKKDHWSNDYERIRRENGYNPLKDVFLDMTRLPSERKWYQKLSPSNRYKLNISQPISEQIATIKDVNPDVIWGYPSAIQIICQNLKLQGIDTINPKLVFTASEILSNHTRQLIENVLDTTVLDVYGSHETGCLAWECRENKSYHTCMDTNAIEFLDKNNQRIESGESGRVIVTNLHSYAMPIIRYEIGDSATPTGTTCSCGRGGYIIKSINGRNNDFIKLPGNRVLSPITILRFLQNYREFFAQYKLIQENEGIFTFYFVKARDLDQLLNIKDLENDLKTLLGENADISIIPVEHIEKDASLKLRSVVSKI